MLVELTIHNLVIVERAVLSPGPGLVVISGETGAGKSLLLDALDLLRGARAQAQLIGRWGEATTVVGVFEVSAARASLVAGACGIEQPEGGQFILRRRIQGGGRSQAWINDLPMSVAALRQAADLLVEYHAQHEPIRLADPAVQLDLLDRFAGLEGAATAYRNLHQQMRAAEAELAGIDRVGREGLKEAEYVRFQLEEFEAFVPRRGEVAELEARHALLASVGEWRALAEEAVGVLSDNDRAVATVIGRLARRLADAPDPGLAEAAIVLRQAGEAVSEAAAACGRTLDHLQADPGELERIAERLDAWHALARKHGDDEEAVFLAWESLRHRLAALAGQGDRREVLVADLARLGLQRLAAGEALADQRNKAFKRLAKAVQGHLADLGMPKARIIMADTPVSEPTALGVRHQEILVCTNPGQEAGSIRAIASGGEAARLMLGLAAALAGEDGTPVMVFDEVDSGVGGRLGAVIGGKLAALGLGRTVLAVTHTPQLAAAAAKHYVVRKDQSDRETRVRVELIEGAARTAEIADMLGGGHAAHAQAQVLLDGGRQ